MRLFVGNLAWSVDADCLRSLFQDVGNVVDARVIKERDSGRSRGFGFVTFENEDEANRALEAGISPLQVSLVLRDATRAARGASPRRSAQNQSPYVPAARADGFKRTRETQAVANPRPVPSLQAGPLPSP